MNINNVPSSLTPVQLVNVLDQVHYDTIEHSSNERGGEGGGGEREREGERGRE